MIPILTNFNYDQKPIGKVFVDNGILSVELTEIMTRDDIFKIFGNAGIVLKEEYICSKTGNTGFLNFTIHAWSFDL